MFLRSTATDVTLKGSKMPHLHRFHLVDGRVIDGHLYREPTSRLVDDLYGTKGDFLCVLDAKCRESGREMPFLVINMRHIICIEELEPAPALLFEED